MNDLFVSGFLMLKLKLCGSLLTPNIMSVHCSLQSCSQLSCVSLNVGGCMHTWYTSVCTVKQSLLLALEMFILLNVVFDNAQQRADVR